MPRRNNFKKKNRRKKPRIIKPGERFSKAKKRSTVREERKEKKQPRNRKDDNPGTKTKSTSKTIQKVDPIRQKMAWRKGKEGVSQRCLGTPKKKFKKKPGWMKERNDLCVAARSRNQKNKAAGKGS